MEQQLALIKFIENLSAQLNKAYFIQPSIKILFGDADKNHFEGACNVLYHRKDMYIAINLPWQQECTSKATDLLICLLTHEYAHYIWALKLSSAERVVDTTRYLSDDQFRRNDEYRTWIHTRKMLRDLGYWNFAVKKACQTFLYSWTVKGQ